MNTRPLISRAFAAVPLLLALGACATPQGPAEVTRFVDPAAFGQLGKGSVFVEAAPGEDTGTLALAPYKAAVAAELTRLGYTESARVSARQIAQVRVQRYEIGREGRRSPVSVGVGGSTGSYGSGVGVGLGINLGGGARPQVGTDIAVAIRDAATGRSLWEGRATIRTADNSPLAPSEANAQTLAAALFSGFPGVNGETIQVEVDE